MKIKIIDDLPPEACAMVQALYSRSPKDIDEHLKKVQEVGADKFMAQYYVGYGHKSIGDCGTTTISIQGVSMLAAKAIQDWPLYSGQEASTRYMDFGKDSNGAQEGPWFDFYRENLPKVQQFLMQKYPTMLEKGVKARAFDIMRAWLPAGALTQLSWHTNLRQAAEKLQLLAYHPLLEVRELAHKLSVFLKEKYPASFSHAGPTDAQSWYYASCEKDFRYLSEGHVPKDNRFIATWHGEEINPECGVFSARPKYTELPTFVESHGYFRFRFTLDFGSYRDLARHRNGVIRVTQLSTQFGFEDWYLEELPPEVRRAAMRKLSQFESDDPYQIPMGFRVGLDCTFPLNAAVYVAELRSSQMVHPTLRVKAQEMARAIFDRHKIAIHADMLPDQIEKQFAIRAKQDITEKQ